MLQLLYISTSRAPVISDEVLEAVLKTSRRNNEAASVSGLLLAGGRRFLQALEGPRSSVEATYERISADPRHFALVELGRTDIERPQFGAWAMAYSHGGSGAGEALRETVAGLTADLSDRDMTAMFNGFAELHSQAA